MNNRARKLANDHWGYIAQLLEAHDESSDTIEICRFHYVEAFVHGYKHALEDLENEEPGGRYAGEYKIE